MTRFTSTRVDLHRDLIHAGWEPTTTSPDVYYRFVGDVRHELHLLYDKAGRLRAWSHWENRRIQIDQDPGLRDRLRGFLREGR